MLLAPRISIPLALRVRPYAALYLMAMLGLGVAFTIKKYSEWDICFLPTSQHLMAGEDIYAQPHGYVYPPLQSLLAVPVMNQPTIIQRLAWFLVNAVSLWIALRCAWRISGGPDLETTRANWREHAACALGLVVGLTYFLNSLMHHQTDILLAALLFAGCEKLNDGRSLQAATLLGLAAAMKCTPLLFAPYLLIRGRYYAAAWLVVVAITASLLPDLIHSPADASTWLSKWWHTYLVPMAGAGHRPGVWASDIIFNQSLVGAVNRWSMTTWTIDSRFQTLLIEPLLAPAVMKTIVLLLALTLGGIALAVMLRRRDLATDCSLVLCGMLLFSPMSSPAHFGILVLPAFVLAREALGNRSRFAGLCLAAMLMLALVSNKDLLGAKLYSLGLWHGTVMAAALIALVGCWQRSFVR